MAQNNKIINISETFISPEQGSGWKQTFTAQDFSKTNWPRRQPSRVPKLFF